MLILDTERKLDLLWREREMLKRNDTRRERLLEKREREWAVSGFILIDTISACYNMYVTKLRVVDGCLKGGEKVPFMEQPFHEWICSHSYHIYKIITNIYEYMYIFIYFIQRYQVS